MDEVDDINFWKNLLEKINFRVPGRFYLARRSPKADWEIVTVLEITEWSMNGDVPQIAHAVYD
jgi:hypothetical protein